MNKLDKYLEQFPAMKAGKIRKTLERRYRYNGVSATSAEHCEQLFKKYGDKTRINDENFPDYKKEQAIVFAFNSFNCNVTKQRLLDAGLWVDNETTKAFMKSTGMEGYTLYKDAIEKEAYKKAVKHVYDYRFFIPDESMGENEVFLTLTKTEYDYIKWLDKERKE
jgi:hypothetical protein